jgi:hypothetical protein
MRNPALQRLQISIDEYRRVVRNFMASHRFELLEQRSDWIQRTERWVQSNFISGSDVNTARIRPSLELVASERQHAIWRYCRLWGSIPYNRGCGRLLRYLLRDEGQPSLPVMGIIALSSPVLINNPRDQWIGWEYPRDADLKRRRLLTCMELSVSMAIPPYNHLTAGKMICLAVLSNEVRQDYWNKFAHTQTPTGLTEGRLALITTTSLYGSSVQYNRLKIDGRSAYQVVGYTSGYGNAHITESEFAGMERFLRDVGKPIPKGWGTGRSYRLRVYQAYYQNRFGNDAPAHDHPRSVYIAPLAANSRSFLKGETEDIASYNLPFSHLITAWYERWLASRLQKPDVVERFRSSNPMANLLSHELQINRDKTSIH